MQILRQPTLELGADVPGEGSEPPAKKAKSEASSTRAPTVASTTASASTAGTAKAKAAGKSEAKAAPKPKASAEVKMPS